MFIHSFVLYLHFHCFIVLANVAADHGDTERARCYGLVANVISAVGVVISVVAVIIIAILVAG